MGEYRKFKAIQFLIFANGASEMVDSITGNITQLVMNFQLMRLIGTICGDLYRRTDMLV